MSVQTEQQRDLRRKAQQLDEVSKTPGWKVLEQALQARARRMKRAMLTLLMDGGVEVGLLQRQIDHDRGFVNGMLYVLTVVDKAASKLKELEDELASEEPDEEEDHWSGYRTDS